MPRYYGFLTKKDRDNIDNKNVGEVRADIRQRASKALLDLETVVKELAHDDFARIVDRWVNSGLPSWRDSEPHRPIEQRMAGLFELLWVGLNENADAVLDYSDAQDTPEGVIRPEEFKFFKSDDWERWLERAIRNSAHTAHVDVSIDVFNDAQLDEIEDMFHDDPYSLQTSWVRALVRTERVDYEDVPEELRPALWESGGLGGEYR